MSYRHQVSDHIQKRASALRRSPWSLSALIDQAFFLLAGLASGLVFWRLVAGSVFCTVLGYHGISSTASLAPYFK